MNTRKLMLGFPALIFASLSLTAQIEAGKSINITIANVPDEDKATITNVYPVSESGTINMPFIGPVRAAGQGAGWVPAAPWGQNSGPGAGGPRIWRGRRRWHRGCDGCACHAPCGCRVVPAAAESRVRSSRPGWVSMSKWVSFPATRGGQIAISLVNVAP